MPSSKRETACPDARPFLAIEEGQMNVTSLPELPSPVNDLAMWSGDELLWKAGRGCSVISRVKITTAYGVSTIEGRLHPQLREQWLRVREE